MSNLARLRANLQKNHGKKIKVGVFSDATYPTLRTTQGETAAIQVETVALTQEYGSPSKNIPPRPFMMPTIRKNRKKWGESLARLAVMEPNDNNYDALALSFAGEVKMAVIDLDTPPLSEKTLERRRKRKESPNSNTKPLVDSKVLLNAIDGRVVK